jgi:hypothetical protein
VESRKLLKEVVCLASSTRDRQDDVVMVRAMECECILAWFKRERERRAKGWCYEGELFASVSFFAAEDGNGGVVGVCFECDVSATFELAGVGTIIVKKSQRAI